MKFFCLIFCLFFSYYKKSTKNSIKSTKNYNIIRIQAIPAVCIRLFIFSVIKKKNNNSTYRDFKILRLLLLRKYLVTQKKT